VTAGRTGLLFGDAVETWVRKLLHIHCNVSGGQSIGWESNGEITAGAIFYNWNKVNINMHIAIAGPISPTFIAAIMDYPFNQLGCRRITGMVAENNAKSRRFSEHLGATVEGVLQDAIEDGNLLVYGLLRKDAGTWLTAYYSRKLGARDGRRIRQGQFSATGT